MKHFNRQHLFRSFLFNYKLETYKKIKFGMNYINIQAVDFVITYVNKHGLNNEKNHRNYYNYIVSLSSILL